MRLLLSGNESQRRSHCYDHALDPATVCREDARAHGAEPDRIAPVCEPPECVLDCAADCGCAYRCVVDADAVLLEVEQGGVAAADNAAVGEKSDAAGDVVLVPDLADNLFEDVLDGNDAFEL